MIYLGSALATQTVSPRFTLTPIPGAVRLTTARPERCRVCSERSTEHVLRDGSSRCATCDAEARQ